jgi:hypothetical protein
MEELLKLSLWLCLELTLQTLHLTIWGKKSLRVSALFPLSTRILILETALRLVHSRRRVSHDECFSGFYVDDFESLGLFTYDESSRTLNCAFVAFLLAARAGVLTDSLISDRILSLIIIKNGTNITSFALGFQY